MTILKFFLSANLSQASDVPSCLFLKHLAALLVKRAIVMRKNFKIYLLQIFLPILFVFFEIYFGYDAFKIIKPQPRLELSADTYRNSITFVKLGENVQKNSSLHEIYESYKLMINNLNVSDLKLEETDTVMEYTFLQKSKTNSDLNYRNLFGFSVNAQNITAWFNTQPYHALPITLNLVHNAILKASFGSDFELHVGNKPLPYRNETRVRLR